MDDIERMVVEVLEETCPGLTATLDEFAKRGEPLTVLDEYVQRAVHSQARNGPLMADAIRSYWRAATHARRNA